MYKIFLLVFFVCLFCNLRADSSVKMAERFLGEGVSLADRGEFAESVKILNRALGILREFPSSHPLRVRIEKQLRITKGKSVVSRYENRSFKNKDSELLPLKNESKDYLVAQIFGKVSSRKVWLPRENLELNNPVALGRRITVFPNAGVELISNPTKHTVIRSLNASSIDLISSNEISLHSGFSLLGVYKNDHKFTVGAPQTSISINADTPFACLFEVATNGGLKSIALLGKITLTNEEHEIELLPGELCFAMPGGGFSRKMSVELSTLMVTSRLITSFGKPLPFMNKLKQQAMMQALRTRKRYRTVVGDAKNGTDFEVKVLESSKP